jgi:ATPase subunit of ABC transporter with duplicated ATPase domains
VRRTGTVGYLPQDPRTGDLETLARDRILGARGLDAVARTMRTAAERMGDDDMDIRERAMRGYDRASLEFESLGGYAADAEAARIAASVGLPERVLSQPIGTLSGGQRRRVELARILFGGYDVLLLDEPTRGLDYPTKERLSTLLRDLAAGGHAIVVATHDVELAAETATRVVVLADGEVVADGPTAEVLVGSPLFAPQVAKVLVGPEGADVPLTVTEVRQALAVIG